MKKLNNNKNAYKLGILHCPYNTSLLSHIQDFSPFDLEGYSKAAISVGWINPLMWLYRHYRG